MALAGLSILLPGATKHLESLKGLLVSVRDKENYENWTASGLDSLLGCGLP